MQGRCVRIGRIAVVALTAIWIAACQTPGGAPVAASGGRNVAQAERFSRDGQFVESAQLYEELAAKNDDLHDRLQLRAAREWLNAGNLQRGEAILKELGE